MNIYLVTIDDGGYDCYSGHVVYAKSRGNAKTLCAKNPGDEGKLIRSFAKVKKVGSSEKQKKEVIILSDFKAG